MKHNSDAVMNVLPGGTSIMMQSNPGGKPSKPVRRDDYRYVEEIECWGDDNLEPQHLVKAFKSNSVLRSALDFIVRALYNGGLEYGYTQMDEKGEKSFTPQRIPEIETMLKCSNHKRQAVKALFDLKVTGNCFPEVILTKDRKKVAMINFNQSPYCRWSTAMDNGRNAFCHISANWDINAGRIMDPKEIIVPVLDNTFDEIEALREAKGYKYIIPEVNYPTIGNSYYSEPVWNAIRTSGWLEYANQIPEFKKNYLENASHIKYVIHVPVSWWKWKYNDWDSLKPAKKKELITKNHQNFDKFLKGKENAGKSLMLTFQDDPEMIKHGYTKWDIQLVDKKVVDKILGGDLLDITQMIYQSVGVHATLLGGAPGASNLGAGSGSDQREAYNIFMALATIDQDIIAKPFELAAEYNGYPNLKFRFNSRLIAALKEITPSKRQEQNAD